MQLQLATKPATSQDLEFVWEVYKEAVRSKVEPHLANGWVDADEFVRFRDNWKVGNSHIITLDGAPIGWGGAVISTDKVLLEHLYIAPAYRGKKYGRRLVSELLQQWAREGKTVHAPILRGSAAGSAALDLGFQKDADGHGPLVEMFTHRH